MDEGLNTERRTKNSSELFHLFNGEVIAAKTYYRKIAGPNLLIQTPGLSRREQTAQVWSFPASVSCGMFLTAIAALNSVKAASHSF